MAALTMTGMALESAPARADDPIALCSDLRAGPEALVIGVPDGDTLLLDSGLKVRLAGIQAPKLPLGRPDFEAWPLGEEAQAALAEVSMGRAVSLHYGGTERDRHNRALAQVVVRDDEKAPVWLQAHMIGLGLARAYSFADNRACSSALLALEGRARAERMGLWAHSEYAIRDAARPDSLLGREGHFELIEGRVVDTGQSGGRVYLNFGRYWKEDFTIVIDKRAQKRFTAYQPADLSGAIVRVRGWIEVDDGPRISLTHPEQLELLARP